MDKFKIIEHTADIGIEAEGKNLDTLFANMAYGMFSQITNLDEIEIKEEVAIDVRAEDLESLLVIFLNELLYQFEIKKMVFKEFLFFTINNYQVTALAKGERIDLGKKKIFGEIKSATYHNLKIKKEKDKWRAQVIFDV